MSALRLSGVTVADRMRHVTIDIPSHAVVGLVGPNGAGKSTLLQIAAGLLPCVGDVAWSGRTLPSISVMERGRCAAWVPQEAHFEFGFSVRSVVGQGRFAHGDDGEGVDQALEQFDLTSLAERPVNQLSGGERHRVLLARAITTQAPLQLWDEPLAALDPRHALKTLRLTRELAHAGSTIILSLHDLRLAHSLDRIAVLSGGHLRAYGLPSEVLSPALLSEVFGVKVRTALGPILELP